MATTMTIKGQVTIPKRVRDALNLMPGDQIEFEVVENGRVALFKAGAEKAGAAGAARAGSTRKRAPAKPDRFEQARGAATVKWKTDELMALLRGEE